MSVHNTPVRLPQGGTRLEVDAAGGGSITPGDGTQAGAIANASAATGVANNADVTTVVVTKAEFDALVTSHNGILAALRGVGVIASS